MVLGAEGSKDLSWAGKWPEPKARAAGLLSPGESVHFSSVGSVSVFATPRTAAQRGSCPSPTPGAVGHVQVPDAQ